VHHSRTQSGADHSERTEPSLCSPNSENDQSVIETRARFGQAAMGRAKASWILFITSSEHEFKMKFGKRAEKQIRAKESQYRTPSEG
jgi:hypothetical protein